jgi:ring-1,2-phenylacetyl-CoA epoxidase subunit PaaD
VVSLVEMGIVRDVTVAPDGLVTVTITPTFAGCAALQVMQADIVARLGAMGIEHVQVELSYSPPWTTDWITEEARAKLKAFGLAPPPVHGGNFELVLMDEVACPYCGSQCTSLRNSFGSTPCRMIYYCNHCQQPFEQFKPL